MAQADAPNGVHTFRVAAPTRVLAPVAVTCVIAFVVVAATIGGDEKAGTILAILGAVLLFALGLTAWLLTRTRLEVSSDGITYYAIGYRVRSTWPNVIGCGDRLQGALSYESLILREPGLELSVWMRISDALMPVLQIAAVAQGEIPSPDRLSRYADNIPVALFEQNWRSGELGRLVRRYAPHAVDNPVP